MKSVLLLIIFAFVYSIKNVLMSSGKIDCFAKYEECLPINKKEFCEKLFSDCVKNIH